MKMKMNARTYTRRMYYANTNWAMPKKKSHNLSIEGKRFSLFLRFFNENLKFSTVAISTIWSFDTKNNTFEAKTDEAANISEWLIECWVVIVLLQYETTTRWNRAEYLACDYERILSQGIWTFLRMNVLQNSQTIDTPWYIFLFECFDCFEAVSIDYLSTNAPKYVLFFNFIVIYIRTGRKLWTAYNLINKNRLQYESCRVCVLQLAIISPNMKAQWKWRNKVQRFNWRLYSSLYMDVICDARKVRTHTHTL